MATITVRGTGTALGSPDEATVGLGSEAVRASAAEALSVVAEQTAALVALCRELELPEGALTTSGVSVREQIEHDREGHPQHRGYRASQRLSVRVSDPALVGDLLTGAVDRAGATVDGPYWRLLPEHAAHADACRAAATDARRRALALAEALGARLGALVSVRDSRIPPPEPRSDGRMMAMEFASASLPVEAGDLAVVAEVDVEFNLEQG